MRNHIVLNARHDYLILEWIKACIHHSHDDNQLSRLRCEMNQHKEKSIVLPEYNRKNIDRVLARIVE